MFTDTPRGIFPGQFQIHQVEVEYALLKHLNIHLHCASSLATLSEQITYLSLWWPSAYHRVKCKLIYLQALHSLFPAPNIFLPTLSHVPVLHTLSA